MSDRRLFQEAKGFSVDANDALYVTETGTGSGFAIPKYDTQVIDESAAPATTTITYSLNGVTVAVKTITVSGTTTTITVV